MMGFACPICGESLEKIDKTASCKNGHSFDIAKSGYINLLMSQQSKNKQHGDDKAMVRARRDFLDKGYYSNLRDTLAEAATEFAPKDPVVLDAGCGECYYTAAVAEHLGDGAQMLGVDISKDALHYGRKRNPNIDLAVGSVFHLPMKNDSCDIVLNVFAPKAAEEYFRVLKPGGILIMAVPLEMHLWELKHAVYEHPYANDKTDENMENFDIVKKWELKKSIHIDNNTDIFNLFSMTPYAHKTGRGDISRLDKLSELDTATEFGVFVYRKR